MRHTRSEFSTVSNALAGALAGLLATALALTALPARAHDDATLDAMATPHGGQLRMAGPLHIELVLVKDSAQAKDNPVRVYLSDHAGKPQPSQGVSASITVLSGKDKASATLLPDGENRLQASARYASRPDLKAVVTVTLPGQPPVQARFTPLAPKPAGAAAAGGMDHSQHTGH